MFDYVTCELVTPDGRKVVNDSFQTKSFWCGMDRFTITKIGRLLFHPRDCTTPGLSAPMADIDMDYHGDLEIHGLTHDDQLVRYAVRFTHGSIEQIRLLEELSEIHRQWLVEKG